MLRRNALEGCIPDHPAPAVIVGAPERWRKHQERIPFCGPAWPALLMAPSLPDLAQQAEVNTSPTSRYHDSDAEILCCDGKAKRYHALEEK